MSAKSVSRHSTGHVAKSSVAKPVVVTIETAWKTPARTAASPSSIPNAQSWIVSATAAARLMTTYSRNSSSRAKSRGRALTTPR